MASIEQLLSLLGAPTIPPKVVSSPKSDEVEIPLGAPSTAKATPPALVVEAPPFHLDGLRIQPWAHQQRGYHACLSPLKEHGACLLAAEMGVGKTFIATMLSLGVGARRTLIVCPLRVIGSWRVQLAQYLSLDYLFTELDDSYTVGKRLEILKKDIELAKARNLPHYIAINYDSFWREPMNDFLATLPLDCVIYDESHKLKTYTSRACQMARRLCKTKHRILATGTHMAHSPLDVYGQWRAVLPNLFGPSWTTFRKQYAILAGPDKKWVTGYQNVDQLEAKIAPYTWRATKEEVLPDLPEQVDIEVPVEMDSEAMKIYRALEKNFIAEVEGRQITAANALTKVLRLQQLTGGSVPTDDDTIQAINSGKKEALQDLLDDLGKAPVVVFCKFRHDIDQVHAACRKLEIESKELSGKFNQLEDWQAGKGQVLAVQMQSGSVGINLTRASNAVYYSLSTSLAEFDQSRARIHRPGQKNACTFFFLTVKGTIDTKILAALRAREQVIDTIMTNIQNLRTT